jgi:hypothetical protein
LTDFEKVVPVTFFCCSYMESGYSPAQVKL